jgi:hypothetical protein
VGVAERCGYVYGEDCRVAVGFAVGYVIHHSDRDVGEVLWTCILWLCLGIGGGGRGGRGKGGG